MKEAKKPVRPEESHLYVVVRNDLPEPYKTVQACHAGIAAWNAFGNSNKTHPNLVICTLPDEATLNNFFEGLKEIGVPCCAWREDDMGDALTAVATGPLRGDQRKPLRWLKLLK